MWKDVRTCVGEKLASRAAQKLRNRAKSESGKECNRQNKSGGKKDINLEKVSRYNFEKYMEVVEQADWYDESVGKCECKIDSKSQDDSLHERRSRIVSKSKGTIVNKSCAETWLRAGERLWVSNVSMSWLGVRARAKAKLRERDRERMDYKCWCKLKELWRCWKILRHE